MDKLEQMCYNWGMSEEKAYELIKIEEDGTEWRKYPNGYIRDQKGRILVLPEHIRENHLITPEKHAEYMKRRKERYMAAMEAGVTEGLQAYGVEEAIAKIMAKRAQVAVSDDGRAGNDAAKLILQALDAFQEKQVKHEHVQRQEYYLDPETAGILERMLDRKREE